MTKGTATIDARLLLRRAGCQRQSSTTSSIVPHIGIRYSMKIPALPSRTPTLTPRPRRTIPATPGDELSDQEGVLDANGQLKITFPTKFKADIHGDFRYRVEARVTDAGNREITGYASVIATYGSFLINVEPADYVVNPGTIRRPETDRCRLQRETDPNQSEF